MIHDVKLTNFQKHRDLSASFDGGLVALRGANEAGKSTLLRGISYALFGTKALPQSLDDTVTWGEPVNSLRAAVTISIDGVKYHVSRGKSGAEVNYDGGTVTGQTEVTKFLCSKLGVSPDAADQLMVSNQSQIRGALEEGVAATTKLIERLADFDRIDELINVVQTYLPTGSTKLMEGMIEETRTRLASAEQRAQELPDTQEIKERLSALVAESEQIKVTHATGVKAAEKAAETLRDLRTQLARYNDATVQLEKFERQMRDAEAAHKELVAQAPKGSIEDVQKRLQVARDRKADSDKVHRDFATYQKAEPLLNSYVSGEIAESNTEKEIATEVKELNSQASTAKANIHEAEKKIISLEKDILAGSCSFCGQDFSNLPDVAEKNSKTQGAIDQLRADIAAYKTTAAASEKEVRELEALLEQVKARRLKLAKFDNLLQIDESSAALKAKWVGEVPQAPQDEPDYDAEIESLQRLEKALTNHAKDIAVSEAKINSLRDHVVAAKEAMETMSAMDEVTVERAAVEEKIMRDAAARLAEKLEQCVQRKHQVERELGKAEYEKEEIERLLKELRGTLTKQESSLKDMHTNNELLKALRLARPRVADKLWNLVLGAVSRYFTQMRGQESRVTRDADGFKVNGHPVAGLSGSTLDILGLAMRVALVRTFLPTAPFLVLDEPAAACDAERTQAMLGFLAATEFTQVLACSHDPISEAVAGSVLKLA